MDAPNMSPGELEIPDAAYEAGERAAQPYVTDSDYYLVPGIARNVLYAAVPLDRAAELRRIADELEVVAQGMREEDDRTIRSSGLGEGIRHLRDRADRYDGGESSTPTLSQPEGDPGGRADAVARVRRFVTAYSAAKEGLDAERVATFDDNRLLLSDLRFLIGGTSR